MQQGAFPPYACWLVWLIEVLMGAAIAIPLLACVVWLMFLIVCLLVKKLPPEIQFRVVRKFGAPIPSEAIRCFGGPVRWARHPAWQPCIGVAIRHDERDTIERHLGEICAFEMRASDVGI